MPHEWNNIWVVTKDELVPMHYNSLDTLRGEIWRYKEKDYGVKQVQKGGNGRAMLIAFDSLSSEIKNAIGDPCKITNPLELFYQVDKDAVRFYTAYRFEDGTSLSLAHQEEYITNASVLRACIYLKEAREYERRTKGGSLKGIMTSICNDVISFNKSLKTNHNIQHTLPASEKRFKEAFKTFENGFNYSSLISGRLKNENRKLVTDTVLAMLNDLFAKQTNKPTRTEVARQYEAFLNGYVEVISTETGEMYDPKDFKPLSDSTVINYLGKWEEKIATYKVRSGDRQRYMGQFKPYHILEKTELAGSLISVDDRQPVFFYEPSKRMWFYMGIDLGSEAFTTWVWGTTKEGIILDFYRQMVRNYTEWGFKLPYGIECESSLNSSYRDTFLKPGVMFDSVRIEANNARGKRIEAYYRQLRYTYEKQREGWLARPFARAEANQSAPGANQIIPKEQIVNGCLRDIEKWNNSPHSVHSDKTRWEVFCEMQNPNLNPTNWPVLLPAIGYKTQTSCNAGIINLENKKFVLGEGEVFTGDRLINAMKQAEGRTIDIYWLDDTKGNVLKAVIYMGDQYICEAVPAPTYKRAVIEQTAKCKINQQIMSAYVMTIEGYIRQKAAKLNDVLVIDNRPTTLNRKFQIPGLERFDNDDDDSRETEILDDEDGADYVEMPAYNTGRKLGDRF